MRGVTEAVGEIAGAARLDFEPAADAPSQQEVSDERLAADEDLVRQHVRWADLEAQMHALAPDQVGRLVDVYRAHNEPLHEEREACAGMEDVLVRLREKGRRLGIVTAKRGVGMEVTADAPRICREQRQEIVRAQIRNALRAAVSSALPDEAIRQLVEEELNHVNGQARPREKQS